jgi:hypothetical protein
MNVLEKVVVWKLADNCCGWGMGTSETLRKGNVYRWKPLPENWWRQIWRLSVCCSEVHNVRNSERAREMIGITSRKASNKSVYKSAFPSVFTQMRDNVIGIKYRYFYSTDKDIFQVSQVASSYEEYPMNFLWTYRYSIYASCLSSRRHSRVRSTQLQFSKASFTNPALDPIFLLSFCTLHLPSNMSLNIPAWDVRVPDMPCSLLMIGCWIWNQLKISKIW